MIVLLEGTPSGITLIQDLKAIFPLSPCCKARATILGSYYYCSDCRERLHCQPQLMDGTGMPSTFVQTHYDPSQITKWISCWTWYDKEQIRLTIIEDVEV